MDAFFKAKFYPNNLDLPTHPGIQGNPETILIYKITKNLVAKLIACKKNAPRPNARPDLLVTIAYGLFN